MDHRRGGQVGQTIRRSLGVGLFVPRHAGILSVTLTVLANLVLLMFSGGGSGVSV